MYSIDTRESSDSSDGPNIPEGSLTSTNIIEKNPTPSSFPVLRLKMKFPTSLSLIAVIIACFSACNVLANNLNDKRFVVGAEEKTNVDGAESNLRRSKRSHGDFMYKRMVFVPGTINEYLFEERVIQGHMEKMQEMIAKGENITKQIRSELQSHENCTIDDATGNNDCGRNYTCLRIQSIMKCIPNGQPGNLCLLPQCQNTVIDGPIVGGCIEGYYCSGDYSYDVFRDPIYNIAYGTCKDESVYGMRSNSLLDIKVEKHSDKNKRPPIYDRWPFNGMVPTFAGDADPHSDDNDSEMKNAPDMMGHAMDEPDMMGEAMHEDAMDEPDMMA